MVKASLRRASAAAVLTAGVLPGATAQAAAPGVTAAPLDYIVCAVAAHGDQR